MSIKSSYLILYNLVQLIGNVCILASFFRYNIDHGWRKSAPLRMYPIIGTYDIVAPFIRIVLLLQWLEILHSALRLSKGSPVAALIQVGFKSVIFFTFLDSYHADETVRASKVAGYLLFIWSLADLIRYPFYLQQLLHADVYLVKWLRHTAWIVLYPIGITLEALVVYFSIPHIKKTGRLRLRMPNMLNMSIDPILLINFYLYVGVVIGSYTTLTYMWAQRQKALVRPERKSKRE